MGEEKFKKKKVIVRELAPAVNLAVKSHLSMLTSAEPAKKKSTIKSVSQLAS